MHARAFCAMHRIARSAGVWQTTSRENEIARDTRQVVSKRRKVVEDMAANVLADFGRYNAAGGLMAH